MTVPARYLRKTLVISPREALVAGGPAEEFERTVQNHLASGHSAIRIDLRDVPHLDSAGIRALVRGHTSAERHGEQLTIVNANQQIRSLFTVSGLDKVFHLGDAPAAGFLTPARRAAFLLTAGGALVVAALLWLGAMFPVSPLPGQGIPGVTAAAPGTGSVLGAVPLIDLLRLVAAAFIGILVAGVQRSLQQDKPSSVSLEHAKVLLCTAGALMMLIIGDSVARAFGIAGAASIVRFRTPIDDPKEITILFLLMGLGMLCGIGAFSVAGVSAAFVCVFLVVLSRLGADGRRAMMVEITARTRDFPAAEIETVFALNRIRFEHREVSQGEKTVGRYYTMLDPKVSLQNLSDQLISDGATNIKSVVWEPVKRGD